MTLKEFIETNNVTAYQTVEFIIINTLVEEACYGLDVDTSNIPGGTPLFTFNDFHLEGDLLTVNNITINTAKVNMLGDLI